MILLRIIHKETGVFIRDGFTFNGDIEIGLDVAPAKGFIYPKWNFEKQEWEENGFNPFEVE